MPKLGNSVYKYIIEIYKILIVPHSSFSWSSVDTSTSSSLFEFLGFFLALWSCWNVVGPTPDVLLTGLTWAGCWAEI
jgi:hypothetical protein